MSLAIKSVDNFIHEQVGNGSCTSVAEVESELMQQLIEKDIDRCIAQGREDIKNGRFTIVNEKTTSEFVKKLADRLLPN